MTNDNKTVEQVCEELRQFKDCDGEYVHEIEDLADEAEAAHKRDIDAYKLLIDRWFHQCHKDSAEAETLRTKNKSLRKLVKELADLLNASCDCHRPCNGCDMADESKFDCFEKKQRALVARAREVEE